MLRKLHDMLARKAYLKRTQAAKKWLQSPVLEIGCGRNQSVFDVSIDLDKHSTAGCIADTCNLPFPKNTYGSVFSVDMIHHIEDRAKLAAEISRVLKKNGRWISFEPLTEGPAGWLRKWLHYEPEASIPPKELYGPLLQHFKITFRCTREHVFWPGSQGKNYATFLALLPVPFHMKSLLVLEKR